jgi:DNA-binding XRE family transcriptional regulator
MKGACCQPCHVREDGSPSFGAALRTRRRAENLTQDAAGALFGISRTTWERFEHDDRMPTAAEHAQILELWPGLPAPDWFKTIQHPGFGGSERGRTVVCDFDMVRETIASLKPTEVDIA